MYKARHAWMFLIPTGILLITFSFLPALAALGLSFTNYNVFQPIEWVGLDNFIRAFKDEEFWRALKNTFYFWILVTPALVVLPIFLAILVNQKLRWIKLFRLTYYFPVLVSVVITAILWNWLFASDGIFNYLLSLVGIHPIDWLTSKGFVMISLAIVTIWQGLGYYMLFYLAGLQSVPTDLYEAAELDGANFWQKHFYITFPMLKPIIFFTAVISTMSAFKEFTLMLTMTNGGPIGASTTVVYLVFEKAFKQLDMGYASAISFILFIIILILTLLNKRSLDKAS
ncbi:MULTISPECIES: carbohydrate ABC transporter permease [Heyndrickxia]|jgi:putative chitobiose transport system permease protein|uniref:Sugar ABC transporter permease n=1 Tax=Heyndrickxia oleronia TaxID=38875 RepID=A0AAW6SV87_9BACI|nr:sugar ABC transporter permease [Heyndrickxia oleronia]NYV65193.1 sugar ABC transporter permease [Bacillus sp. Gen3]OJH20232.1 lactose ABC transporter permease [Bacillus obstructivus]MBU5213049.1 sugar ABC transporter permease [Heyndrickxia oleronia]MCI1589934.1 sugar ABC transporter permease [Heyndrickxia oleronia]MCI1611645.1 sugar ABC transporter permease [Heyndrickxia oleronia]